MAFWRRSKGPEKSADAAAETPAAADSAEETAVESAAASKAAAADVEPQTLEEITPNKRRRLQQFFVVGKKNLETGNSDYAAQMLQQPVFGDPANLEYAQAFFDALHKKYDSPKKIGAMASLQGMPIKAAMKKAAAKKQWRDVIKAGTDMMLINPWDVPTLVAMAEACQELGADEAQLFYLKVALQNNPKDPKLQRLAALALARIGDFGQAIVCWHRVEEAKPGDEEALRMISQLTVERTVPRDKLVESKQPLNKPAAAGAKAAPAKSAAKEKKAEAADSKTLTREEQLLARVEEDPTQKEHYTDLADFYADEGRMDKAEQWLTKALSVAGPGDIQLREKLEEFQMARAARQVEIAEHRAAQEQTEEAAQLVKKLRMEQNRVELEVYAQRCERVPANDIFRYELAVRLKRAGKFKEAIENLQKCQASEKRKAAVHLELGECFQCINMHKLSMDNYEKSIDLSRDKDIEVLKKGLYRAGKLATGLKDFDAAEQHLTELAGLDFGYRDVAERLDKLSRMRNDG